MCSLISPRSDNVVRCRKKQVKPAWHRNHRGFFFAHFPHGGMGVMNPWMSRTPISHTRAWLDNACSALIQSTAMTCVPELDSQGPKTCGTLLSQFQSLLLVLRSSHIPSCSLHSEQSRARDVDTCLRSHSGRHQLPGSECNLITAIILFSFFGFLRRIGACRMRPTVVLGAPVCAAGRWRVYKACSYLHRKSDRAQLIFREH